MAGSPIGRGLCPAQHCTWKRSRSPLIYFTTSFLGGPLWLRPEHSPRPAREHPVPKWPAKRCSSVRSGYGFTALCHKVLCFFENLFMLYWNTADQQCCCDSFQVGSRGTQPYVHVYLFSPIHQSLLPRTRSDEVRWGHPAHGGGSELLYNRPLQAHTEGALGPEKERTGLGSPSRS